LVYDDVAGETWLTEYYVKESNQGLLVDFETSGPVADFGNLHDRYDIPPEFIRDGANRPPTACWCSEPQTVNTIVSYVGSENRPD
jgi:hypothetical protein